MAAGYHVQCEHKSALRLEHLSQVAFLLFTVLSSRQRSGDESETRWIRGREAAETHGRRGQSQ